MAEIIGALGDTDETIRENALLTLEGLENQEGIDALCAIWAQDRDAGLGQMLSKQRYVATAPARLRALSGLQAGAIDLLRQADGGLVAEIIGALGDTDETIRENALLTLEGLGNQEGIDALCAIWAQDRDAGLGQMLSKQRYVATAPARLRALSGLQAGAVDLLRQADGGLVAEIVSALGDTDETIRENALLTLEGLENQEGIDALCAIWAQDRDTGLGQMLSKQRYVAKAPARLRVLSGLKAGAVDLLRQTDGGLVAEIVSALVDTDETISENALLTLEGLENQEGIDALCEAAIQDAAGPAAKLCIRTGKRPSDHERACLFLFVTRQLDAYFEEDFEFQNLRLQYDRADEAVRAQVMEVVRSGDRRCAGFFGTRSKPLRQCSEAEIKLALDSWVRHREWSRLFHASLELPLKYSLPLLTPLGQSGFEPESPDLQSVFRQILADGGDQSALPAPQKPASESSLLETWLTRGRDGDLARLSAAELIKRLEVATPPEGVALTAALATKGTVDDAAVQAVKHNPHWLVRLAGHLTGIFPPDLQHDTVQDANHWITELVASTGVLEVWPGESTPVDLEALSATPPEAWVGRLGSARKVLRTVMTHRITTGTFEPMVVEAAEFAGEFVEAGEIEFETGSGA